MNVSQKIIYLCYLKLFDAIREDDEALHALRHLCSSSDYKHACIV